MREKIMNRKMKKTGLILITMFAAALLFTACKQASKSMTMVKKELYGNYKGKDVYLLTLTNKDGNVLKLTSFGARITWIEVPDRNGKKENVTFGYDTFDSMVKGDPYFGAIVGRYANRIAKGKFSLGGNDYSLTLNNGPNSLHGGPGGWHSVVWDCIADSGAKYPTVRFRLSPRKTPRSNPSSRRFAGRRSPAARKIASRPPPIFKMHWRTTSFHAG